jgi:hypothetical protein
MNYIFMAGAPGSKWSSVAQNIYHSADIDRSDYHDSRTYYHDATGQMQLMHTGAYFDPGMEFGKFFDQIYHYGKQECEIEFDRAFAPDRKGIRIIKSHVFSNRIDFLRARWPDVPIILVQRDDDACLGWWVKCGHFNITYPKYAEYYHNLQRMAGIIRHQNQGIAQAIVDHAATKKIPQTNIELCDILGIARPIDGIIQHYQSNDIRITVI